MNTVLPNKSVSANLPTEFGTFQMHLYKDPTTSKEHLALVMGKFSENDATLVRIHSECLTGDIFQSRRCDCGYQLHSALKLIATEKKGALIYLRQEGRGIGLESKLRAYNLQDQGFDTVEANTMLGHKPDERDYSPATQILADLSIKNINLISNNPDKITFLENHGFNIKSRIEVPPYITNENESYLKTKVEKMGHILDVSKK